MTQEESNISSEFSIVRSLCPLCDSEYAYFDDIHFEYVCIKCGCITNDAPLLISYESNDRYYDAEGCTYNSKEKVSLHCNSLEKKHGNKKQWYKNQKVRYVRVIHTQLHLSDYQKMRAEYIIARIPDYRPLCGNNKCRIDIDQILTTICIMLMQIDNNLFCITKNEFCNSINLDDELYIKILFKLQDKYEPILTFKEKEYIKNLEVGKWQLA